MKRLCLLLSAPALFVPTLGFGADNIRLYDAKAIYACLQARPEYRPWSFDWYPGEPGVKEPPALAFYVFGRPPRGGRHARNWPVRGQGVGASWGFGLYPVRFAAFAPPRIAVFDHLASAQAAYQSYLQRARSSRVLATARRLIEIHRNVTVDWDSLSPNKQKIGAIVLGCLRTQ